MKRGEDINKNRKKGFPGRKKWLRYVLIGSLTVGLGAGGYWWFFLKGRVTTDDAYVVVDIASVSSRINGTVSAVLVENDQFVNKGQVLVELDPRDNRVSVDEAQGVLAQSVGKRDAFRPCFQGTLPPVECLARNPRYPPHFRKRPPGHHLPGGPTAGHHARF